MKYIIVKIPVYYAQVGRFIRDWADELHKKGIDIYCNTKTYVMWTEHVHCRFISSFDYEQHVEKYRGIVVDEAFGFSDYDLLQYIRRRGGLKDRYTGGFMEYIVKCEKESEWLN